MLLTQLSLFVSAAHIILQDVTNTIIFITTCIFPLQHNFPVAEFLLCLQQLCHCH